jgi:activator of HSP90 ATPase
LSIHQEVSIAASPDAIYTILTHAADFSAMTGGMAASIAPEAGGAFSLFDGYISGRNIELIPGKRLVQAWRAANWPEGQYSIIRFELTPNGAGATLVFDQIGHPDAEHLTSGWSDRYWAPMKAMLAKGSG